MANNWKNVKGAIFPGVLLLLAIGVTTVGCVGLFQYHYQQKIYPGVRVGRINVSGLSPAEAQVILAQQLELPFSSTQTIQIALDDIVIASNSAELGVGYDIDALVRQAYNQGRQGSWSTQLASVVTQFLRPTTITPQVTVDEARARLAIEQLALRADYPGEKPTATLKTSGKPDSLVIFGGRSGRRILVDETLTILKENVAKNEFQTGAMAASTSAELTPQEITAAGERARKYVGRTIHFTAGDVEIELSDKKTLSLLAFPAGFDEATVNQTITEWEKGVGRPAQEPTLTYDEQTLSVSAFVPPRDGLALDLTDATEQLLSALTEIESTDAKQPLPTFPLKVAVSHPKTNLSKLNNLGISQKIGFGESEYDHSIPSRIHNVALAASRINNHIIKPGQEFRFNDALGDVSKETGFQPAYVIKSGQTVLGDGGGVCQVSTTVFRAVLNAGLPVTKRRAHSYRVSYYELDSKPGVDATVYAGDVDLRFRNDTGHHILIHTETDSKNLYMKVELYGTSDGRTAEIIDHKTWDPRPAPPAEFIPDPTLPPGVKKQVDWAASGIKASFKNVVKDKAGVVIRTDEYYSNYIPWSAKYLVGPS